MNPWTRLLLSVLPALWLVIFILDTRLGFVLLAMAICGFFGWAIWEVTGSASGQGRNLPSQPGVDSRGGSDAK